VSDGAALTCHVREADTGNALSPSVEQRNPVQLQTVGPKSIHSGNGLPLIALRCLLLMLVSTLLQTVNCWLLFWFP